jgi:hypothetical protein
MSEVTYGRTPKGQLLYDLGFTDLTPEYLARKHGIPASEIPGLREKVRKVLFPKKKRKRS